MKQVYIDNKTWFVCEGDYKSPSKAITFAFDTETLLYLDECLCSSNEIFEKLKDVDTNEKRRRLRVEVWAWQVYSEENGFFMTNNFDIFLDYLCRSGCKYGWCYNATFDFAQIDYQLLAIGKDKWKPLVKEKGKSTKGQAWAYSSLHSGEGARYSYKLWVPYKDYTSHHHVHTIQINDFMKIVQGGLKNVLQGLDVKDNEGNKIRKLEMDYQAVNTSNLTEEEIAYCINDVKGLYFAVKQFNQVIEAQSNNESHIFGKHTNIMTAGGFAKRELLRSMYPDLNIKNRIKKYQWEHPITNEEDRYFRDNHLYRGGIAFVNPRYKGKMLTEKMFGRKMNRYDVNSEYPYCMSIIDDLIGIPQQITMENYRKLPNKDEYECIYILDAIYGTLRKGMVGIWYDPVKRDYVDIINEKYTHLIFKEELEEYSNWYELDYTCNKCIIIKKGTKAYSKFVYDNYKLKAQAKKEGNKVLQQVAKLKLNSSYGKLAERVEKVKGHYELNKETGAIHFVEDGIEVDKHPSMNVIVGAKVTSKARCYILSKIREICKVPSDTFIYIDTDSIHAFATYDKADPYTLGGLKLEAECSCVKYILPKTYIDIENMEDIKESYELHCKGINTNVVKEKLDSIETLTDKMIDETLDYGQQFKVLLAMNVVGGKALVPTLKYIARPELKPDDKVRYEFEDDEMKVVSER